MNYEVVASKDLDDAWVVEAIDYEGEGEVYAARFTGPHAQERAAEYAAWKNSQVVVSQ